MDKVYLVYEGTYEDGHYDGTDGYDEYLAAVYPIEDMASHHLELWVSKTLKEIEILNKEVDEWVKDNNDMADEANKPEWRSKPTYWLPDKIDKKWKRSFSRYDDQKYCYYEEHEVLQEVRVE